MEEYKFTAQPKPKHLLWTFLLDYGLFFLTVSLVFAMCVIFVPSLSPFSLMFRIYRTVLIHIVKKKNQGKAAVVSAEDAIWLQDAPKNRAIITCIIQLKGKPDIEMFRNKVMESLILNKQNGKQLFPKLSSYPTKTFSRYVWIKDENFDIKDHIFFYSGQMPTSAKELTRAFSDITSTPLPEKKPAWQVVMFPPVSELADETYRMFMRVHHSVGDGVSLVNVIMGNVMDVAPKNGNPRRFGTKGKTLKAIKALFLGPFLLIRSVLMSYERHCLHKNNISGVKLLAWSRKVDLELIKKIKDATKTTVNDVLMSCLAGTFRDYLTKFSSNVPKEIVASIPVDVRSPGEQPVLDNQFALILMRIPMHIDDSLKRLEEVKRRMNKMKSSPEALVNALFVKFCMARLPKWFTRMFFDWLSDKCTMVLSNLPGPQEELSICGDPIEDMTFWPPQRKDIGMGISIFSYNGHVRMGIMMDKEVLSDPGIITEKFEEQIYELANRLKLE